MSTDFSSIDRLIEFGMGMSLAQQMVNTMNYTMANMRVPGVNGQSTGCAVNSAMPSPNAAKWYAVVDDRQAGPLTDAEMTELVRRNKISNNTLIWCAGMPAWRMAQDIPEINKILLLN